MKFQQFPGVGSVVFLALLFTAAAVKSASVPPAQNLLPADSLVVFSIPDFAQAKKTFLETSQSRLWHDPAMNSFRKKFYDRIKAEYLEPLDRELGIKWENFRELPQGQLTIALTQNGWTGRGEASPAWLVIIDCREKSGLLRTNLADLKKKWMDGGKSLKVEKLRNVELMTVSFSPQEWPPSFRELLPSLLGEVQTPMEGAKPLKREITLAQAGTLLVIGNSFKEVEKVAILGSGGIAPTLADQAVFESDRNLVFRNSLAFAWVHTRPMIDNLLRGTKEPQSPPAPTTEADPPAQGKILEVLGLTPLKSIALGVQLNPEGALAHLFLGLPESTRQSLLRAILPEEGDASPPYFVPADAAKFSRWRINGQKAWTALEGGLNQLLPQSGESLKFMEGLLKEKDPNFDLRKSLINNLGKDYITWQKAPKVEALLAGREIPALTLLAVQNPEQLQASLKTVITSLASADGKLAERDFQGRKIFSFSTPATETSATGQLHYAFHLGYLSFSPDSSLVEEFLRSTESSGKSLTETSGVREAAEKINGMKGGYFGFNHHAQTMKATLEKLKHQNSGSNAPALLTKGLPVPGLVQDPGKTNRARGWFDYSLLPPFEAMAPYLHYTVFSGQVSTGGFHLRSFSPHPPAAKR